MKNQGIYVKKIIKTTLNLQELWSMSDVNLMCTSKTQLHRKIIKNYQHQYSIYTKP